MTRARPFHVLVDDFESMTPAERASELAWRKAMIPKLQRELAAARQADRRQRRKVAG